MRKPKYLKDIGFFCMILLLVLVMLLSGLRVLESTVLSTETGEEAYESKTIYREDTAWFPRQDITTVLLMGIDRYGPVEHSGTYNNRGAADMAMVVVLDHAQEVVRVLQLNRDTMVEMPVLGIGGRPAGTAYGQLALAHTQGSGLADSCENMVKTVSDLLYGLEIDYYVAMNMDAIPILNDAVGGVTVTVTEDFSAVDPTIRLGEMTLLADQSIHYVRTRKGVGDQLNLSRIQRQRDYVNGFVDSFQAAREKDGDLVADMYEAVSEYLVTDLSVTVVSALIDRYSHYSIAEVVSPQGENVLGEVYFEFYVDEQDLDDLILRLFYAPKE